MAQHVLSDKAVQAAIRRAIAEAKPNTINDGGGLSLIARPDGAGWWRFRYWLQGKENRLSLGTYEKVSLALARSKRDDAVRLVGADQDPSEARKADKVAAVRKREAKALADAGLPGPGTFEHVAREWLSTVHVAKVSASHAERTRIRLEQDVFPWLGRRPIGEIESPELLAVLRRIIARGAIETAHRAKNSCGQVFRHGIATGACKRNPAPDLLDALPPAQTKHLAAVTDPKQAGELLRAMSNYAGHPVTRAALSLSALLFLRPGELRQMQWAWVDLEAAVVTLPSQLMKRKKADKANGAPHTVPLAPQAVAILRDLHTLTGTKLHVFPSLHTGERPMSENTINVALRRMGFDKETASAHGFRAMARTLADERLNIAPAVIEAQLAHAVGDALGRAYNRTQFMDQRRDLMVRWADYLDWLRDGAKVVAIKVGAL